MRVAFFASVLLLATGLCPAQSIVAPDDASGPSSPPKQPISFDLSSIDTSVDPCVDFYHYACGNWIKNNPIPDDKARWSQFDELRDHNDYLLYLDLKAAAAAPKTPLQIKYGNFYAACMNVSLANQLAAKPIAPELAAIAAVTDKKSMAALDVESRRRFGGSEILSVTVEQDQKDSSKQILTTGQGGITLPDRDYYITQDDRSQKIRDQYVAHMTKMFVLLGDTPAQAATEAADTMRIETALAQGSTSRVEMRDPANRYHILTIAETQALIPTYNFTQLLEGERVATVSTLNVSSPGYLKALNVVLQNESLDAIKHYLRWHALHPAAPQLSDAFATENFNFFQATLNGQLVQTPRWQRCTRATDAALGEAVGQDWVKQNFPPSAKANMDKLVTALTVALGEDLKSLPWMSD